MHWLLFILLIASENVFAQSHPEQWADSVLRRMSTEEKIRQLFILPVTPGQLNPASSLIDQVQNQKPGGILITAGGPVSNARMIKRLQSSSEIPLLVVSQAEWGLGQTLDSIALLPVPAILGATSDSLSYVTGILAARQMKSIGAHLNMGLNADADVPPAPSMVSYRYFGDDPQLVQQRISAYLKGLQKEGVLGGIRHLPGSRDFTRTDFSTATRLYTDSIELMSFVKLLRSGAQSINTAYLHYVIKQRNKWLPVTRSREFIPMLREKATFDGLVITEASFIKNFSSSKKGEAELMAFETGHDLIIAPEHMDAAVRKIQKLVRRKTEYASQLQVSARRILISKYLAGAHQKINSSGKIDQTTRNLIRQLDFTAHTSAVTVIKNDNGFLPVQHLSGRRFYLVDAGGYSDELKQSLERYVPFISVGLKKLIDTVALKNLKKEDVVLLAWSDRSLVTVPAIRTWLNSLVRRTQLVILHSGNPDQLDLMDDLPVVIEGYYPPGTESYVAQILFGALPSSGRLPFRGSKPETMGLSTGSLQRLAYSVPELSDMSSEVLDEIDSIALEAIRSGATPGCRVILARKGRVVFNRSYGSHTYDNKIPVAESSIYDLASVTKVAATLQTTMYLYEKGMLDLQRKASYYLPELRESNKSDFTLKDILAHQAGLWPYLPFWTRTMKDGALLPEYYNSTPSPEYPFVVSKGLFARHSIRDSLWNWIVQARIIEKKDRTPFNYRYSDMGFYLLQHLFEKLMERPMEEFLDDYLYHPLGAYTTGFLPLNEFREEEIAPTEDDTGFRKSLLTGYVHDQGAAMHGGVAGHAGLFSNANDLAKLGQMWLQEGVYGARRYFKPETIRYFTTRQYQNSRRGIGWDKPWPEDPSATPTGSLASINTFGHTGFTGTSIWVDPDSELVYVFLSNRVHPDMNNTKLIDSNIRTRIHDVAYKSIQAFQSINP